MITLGMVDVFAIIVPIIVVIVEYRLSHRIELLKKLRRETVKTRKIVEDMRISLSAISDVVQFHGGKLDGAIEAMKQIVADCAEREETSIRVLAEERVRIERAVATMKGKNQ